MTCCVSIHTSGTSNITNFLTEAVAFIVHEPDHLQVLSGWANSSCDFWLVVHSLA